MTRKIKVAIAGLGSCASAIIQGLTFYKDANDDFWLSVDSEKDFEIVNAGWKSLE